MTVAAAIDRFFFAPARPRPLAILRIGLAATLLAQALQVAPLYFNLYHHGGLLRGAVREAYAAPAHLPAIGGLFPFVGSLESAALAVLGAAYVAALVALLLGWRTRVATIVAWLLHLVFMLLAPRTNYGADAMAQIFLFYALWAPMAGDLALDRAAGRTSGEPSAAHRCALRVMQLHLCLAYLCSGVEKATGKQWWNGEAIWRSLVAQNYSLFDFTWLADWPVVAVMSGWCVLLIEVGYPILIWPRATRRAWVVAVVAMHAGIGLFLGLHVFAMLMITLTVALFGVSAESGQSDDRSGRTNDHGGRLTREFEAVDEHTTRIGRERELQLDTHDRPEIEPLVAEGGEVEAHGSHEVRERLARQGVVLSDEEPEALSGILRLPLVVDSDEMERELHRGGR